MAVDWHVSDGGRTEDWKVLLNKTNVGLIRYDSMMQKSG
jgi:hypothetical protein